MLNKIRNLFLYAGLDKESYKKIGGAISLTNRKNIKGFSIIAMLTFLFVTMYAFSRTDEMHGNIPAYIASFIFFVIMHVVSITLGKKYKIVVTVSVYLFMAALLFFGIYLGPVLTPENRTVSFFVILMIISSLFHIKPIGFIFLVIYATLVYIVVAMKLQTGSILTANLVNACIYGCLSMATGTYIMTIRASKYESDSINEFLSFTDQMTGLGNRRKFEAKLESLRHQFKPVAVITVDINNLKKTNDKLGHTAGDELIKATSGCLLQTFGKYGDCYRTGGDEFIAIVSDVPEIENKVAEDFSKMVASWKGKIVDALSVSYGIMSSSGHPGLSIDELVLESDRMMYEAKANYYRSMHIERRK